jgi:hypothetical protein
MVDSGWGMKKYVTLTRPLPSRERRFSEVFSLQLTFKFILVKHAAKETSYYT